MRKTRKVYDVRMRNATATFMLEDPKRVVFHGIPCIRGINRTMKDTWWGPATVLYLAISEIVNIYEFPSLAAARAEWVRFNRVKE